MERKMANKKKMDQVILGLLSHESMSGYEIKKRIDMWLTFFWNASYGSIYPTLNELEQDKLVTKNQTSDKGRNKNIYAITDAGKQHLQKWLESSGARDELRYETLLKVFFGSESGMYNTINQINEFERKIEQSLPMLKMAYQNLEGLQEEETHKFYLLTVMFGIKTYNAYLEWCKEAKQMLESEVKGLEGDEE